MYLNNKISYIVTFKKDKISHEEAEMLVGKSLEIKENFTMVDGISALSGERQSKSSAALHFKEIGTSIIDLNENELKNIQQLKEVEQVVKNFQVRALGCSATNFQQFADIDEYDIYRKGFEEGYQQAVNSLTNFRKHSFYKPTNYNSSNNVNCPPGTHPECVNETEPEQPPVCPPGTRLECVPDKPSEPPDTQPAEWNMKLINANKVWNKVTGRNVKVAVIDTGINSKHPDLSVAGGKSFVPFIDSWEDDNGHGTHCAGIISARSNTIGVTGVAPECSLYAIKVLEGTMGFGWTSWILAGMGWAAENGMDIVSMSLGGNVSQPDEEYPIAYERAAKQLIDSGCIVIAAAGNSGDTDTPWVGVPARCPSVMAVGAIDKEKKLAYFSSNGPDNLPPFQGVEIVAPGVSVNSTWPSGEYKELSGTSMACPHVSGGAALIKQMRPTMTPGEIRERLILTAADLGAPKFDSKYGAGLLDCYRSIYDN